MGTGPSRPLSRPNYDDNKSWASLPIEGHEGFALARIYPQTETDTTTGTQKRLEQDLTPMSVEDINVDTFFVHPTTAVITWDTNYSMLDEARDAKVKTYISTQASVFGASTRVYAPYYRQSSLLNYGNAEEENYTSFEVSYGDVRAAFFNYLSRFNINKDGTRRPFILAGHSQGSQHLARLIKDEFNVDTERGGLLRRLCVCAYLPGYVLGPSYFEGHQGGEDGTKYMKPAEKKEDAGGVYVSWCTLGK